MPPTKRSYLKYQEVTPRQLLACIILELQLLTFPFNNVLGYKLQLMHIFPFWWLNLPLRERNNFTVKLKTYNYIVFTNFQHKIISFSKYWPWVYSYHILTISQISASVYKIYSYKKQSVDSRLLLLFLMHARLNYGPCYLTSKLTEWIKNNILY